MGDTDFVTTRVNNAQIQSLMNSTALSFFSIRSCGSSGLLHSGGLQWFDQAIQKKCRIACLSITSTRSNGPSTPKAAQTNVPERSKCTSSSDWLHEHGSNKGPSSKEPWGVQQCQVCA
jgi:hypothetical protein